METPIVPQPKTILFLADHREAASPVPDELRQLEGVEVRFQRLSVGDYEVNRRCLFERKTLVDFAASIIDGRLFYQAQKLARADVPVALILEGGFGQVAATGVRREALQGALISLGLVFHIPVIRALDAKEAARVMVYAAQQLERQESYVCTRHGRRPKGKRRLQSHILQGLPGIGPMRAEDLLARFGTVLGVFTARQELLEHVPGIGPKTAAAILEALHEQPPSYGNPPSLFEVT
jgi:DNA excision repair protein ERCC-4